MSVIGTVASAAVNVLTGGLVDRIVGLGKAWLQKEISEAEFRAEVEKSANDTAARITESLQATIRSSPVLQRALAFVMVSQTLVLLLYQLGGPLWPMITGDVFPAPVITVEWAYALVGLCITGGAVMLRK